MNGIIERQVALHIMLVAASSRRAYILFITYLDVLQAVWLYLLQQGKDVLGIVFDVDGERRLRTDDSRKLHELRNGEAVRRIPVPMPIIGLTFEPTAYHVSGHVLSGIDHCTTVSEKGQVLLTEGFRNVGTERISVGAEQHLVNPNTTLFRQF